MVDVADEGYLWYCEEQGQAIYICSTLDRFMDGGGIGLDGDRLWISIYSYLDFCFEYLDGRGGHWQGATGSNWDDEYREDFELYHRDISEFEGTWYYNNDLLAESYIMIDGDGNWSFYQCTPGDAEATEIDTGTFAYDMDEAGIYYANSMYYDDMSYLVFDFDEGVLIWGDEGTYYWMENWRECHQRCDQGCAGR